MKRYVCLLRGINVGGHRKILMKDLIILFEESKLKNIKTYLQSGNVSFDSKEESNEILESKIKLLIEKQYGFEVQVIVLAKEEIQKTINCFPFSEEKNTYVTFLQSEPSIQLLNEIKEVSYLPEEFTINGKVIYLKCVEKYHQSKLSNNFFEKKLRVNATTRNWKTVNKLKELAEID